MFLKNCWYCGGWDYQVTQAKDSLVVRKIAGEQIMLYRTPEGTVVAMEDRCCHRQAPLSLGRKELDCVRCMYHGLKYAPDGRCIEIPGQQKIPDKARVRVFPVVEKNNWIWIWMGDPAKADPGLIPFSVGYGDPDWSIKPSCTRINTNYRNEIANLADLSHLAWVHGGTIGGNIEYSGIKPELKLTPRGLDTKFVVRSVVPPPALTHLFPEGTRFDISFDIQHTVPCTWIMSFRIHLAGSATQGDSDGPLLIDSWSCQAVTPRDAESVDYYYSWGANKQQDRPGLSEMFARVLDAAFVEDTRFLEGQQQRMAEKPGFDMIDIKFDEGPKKMLWVLDKLLKEEEAATDPAARRYS